MKEFVLKHKVKIILLFALILQTIIFIITGANKSYIHMDEAYSLGLASYDKVEIQDNEDFYNTWHNKEYYEDYLSVQENEKGNYSPVYENQKNDVHPPLYYLLLRFAMGFSIGHYSKWPGIIVNIVIYLFITIFMYLIIKKLLKDDAHSDIKAIILALASSLIMSSLTNVIYIRMYSLATLNVIITTYLHIKLQENNKPKFKLLFAILVIALIGSLTHYYYLFYLAMLYLIFAIKYIKKKEYKNLIYYTLTMCIAAVISLLIFPHSLQHMFFGYRGQGVIENLKDIPKVFLNIMAYLLTLNYFTFNNMICLILIAIIIILIYQKHKNIKLVKGKNEFLKIVYLPTIFYFILASLASPWIELRYIMPICALIFVLIMYGLYKLLRNILTEKNSNIVISIILILILLAPLMYRIEPQVMYGDKKQIVEEMSEKLNVPTVFFFNSQNNRFLDDILLFATVDESYIAKDIEYTTQNISKILDGKDLSNGMVVFINEGQNNDYILEQTKKALNLKEWQYLKRMNACDVYYLK